MVLTMSNLTQPWYIWNFPIPLTHESYNLCSKFVLIYSDNMHKHGRFDLTGEYGHNFKVYKVVHSKIQVFAQFLKWSDHYWCRY